MSPKRFSLKSVLLDVGAAIGGALGVAALMRRLTGAPAESHDGAPSTAVDHDATRHAISVQPAPNASAMQATTSEPREAPRAVDVRPDTPPVQPRIDQTAVGSLPPAHPSLPRPTYWPAVAAFGITLIAWGFVTTFYISLVGFLVLLLAIGGWIGELLHEH